MRWDWDFMFQTASTEAGDYTANAAAGRPRLRGDDVSEKRGVQTAFALGRATVYGGRLKKSERACRRRKRPSENGVSDGL
ncbi:hypothetical protein ACLD9W_01895 [Neisseria sp. WLZKY-1]|uniref:hypothetical protein n=1 Tax=Neisseria sp. WLZKY-1 TaxID=3390377 RepID=UPI003978E35C